MEHPTLMKMAEFAGEKDAHEATIQYITDKLSFLKKGEKVLILFYVKEPDRIGSMFAEAVRRAGAEPVLWMEDVRWNTLLRVAFSSRATTIIGPPLIILGLSKLAKYKRTPLYIRNVVTAGYPCLDWMLDGIVKGLDCRSWGCYEPGAGPVVAGFSCGESRGVHLRDDVYVAQIVDSSGKEVPAGGIGEILLYQKDHPETRYHSHIRARLENKPCRCGNPAPRLVDISHGKNIDEDVANLGQYLHSWTSILDCAIRKGPYGLEMELTVFPGEKLPELPSCAKQIIRPWNPEKDFPYMYIPQQIGSPIVYDTH
jgi:hypothetical protein